MKHQLSFGETTPHTQQNLGVGAYHVADFARHMHAHVVLVGGGRDCKVRVVVPLEIHRHRHCGAHPVVFTRLGVYHCDCVCGSVDVELLAVLPQRAHTHAVCALREHEVAVEERARNVVLAALSRVFLVGFAGHVNTALAPAAAHARNREHKDDVSVRDVVLLQRLPALRTLWSLFLLQALGALATDSVDVFAHNLRAHFRAHITR